MNEKTKSNAPDGGAPATATTNESTTEHSPMAVNLSSEKGAIASNEEPKSSRTAHGFTWVLIVSGILMANFLFATDNTISANIQPEVIRSFNSLDKLPWLGVAFLGSSWGTNFFW